MRLERIYESDVLYNSIVIAFKGDDKLFDTYHVVNGALTQSVNDTFERIINTAKEFTCEWYNVIKNDAVIGFCVMSKAYNVLYSFGIGIEHRAAEVLAPWFEIIAKELGDHFTCTLWAKNTRAIDYLIRNGMEIFSNNNLEVKLKYN